MTEALRLLAALQLLTRLPLPDMGWAPGRLRAATRYFPLAGALVGAAGAAVWLAAGQGLAAPLAAGLAIAAQLWLTGALHEDGLADCADAFGGQAPAAKALEILRDPRIGSYGACALVLALGLRWAALAGLPPAAGALALVVGGALGRAGILVVLARLAPARPDGLAASLAPGPGAVDLGVGFGTALICAALAGWLAGLAALAAAALAALALARLAARRLGGYTGDVLGAAAVAAELAALLALSAAWG